MNRRNGSETTDSLYQLLDFRQGTGLVSVDAPPGQVYEQMLLEAAHKKLKVDSIFFYRPPNGGTSVPYIYFRRLEGQDAVQVASDIAELHKLAWNMGQAPLLIVTLPSGQVLIYNNYVPPSEYAPGTIYQTGLIESLNIFAEAEKSRRSLLAYHRSELESGRYWSANKARFDLTKRADYTLLENLKVMRRKLLQLLPASVEPTVASSIVHSLLGRSIFIKYLEDRADANNNNVFPEGFFEQFLLDASDFVGVLKERKAAYDLFGYLEAKFNGDIFPVSEEEKQYIDETHLGWLSSFLQGEERLSTGQLGLWKFYSFDVIPIEFISNIYEEFFHIQQTAQGDSADDNGTHYTPHHLVEFLVDEVFPWESTNTECRVLDPACGSGIFLVEVYRRLIERWHQANPDKLIDFAALERLLTRNIFGVDCNEEAVRVAAFSLYLTLCDYLEPRHIWDKVRFPSLKGKNLFAEDFFRHGGNDARYELVIGNPPWQSELTPDAEVYRKDIEQRHLDRQIAPDNQIALAFLWKSAELCKPDGEICLLMPSKGLLFNRSGSHRAFRRAFFSTYHVKTVVNFSALRHSLFDKGVGPGAAVFFAPRPPDNTTPILYCSPNPSHSVEDKWQFIIDPYDIAQLPRIEARDSDVIWKVAMWGGARDYELIKRLMSEPFTRLGTVCDSRNWMHGEGLIVAKKTNDASIYYGKPYVPVQAVQRFALNEDTLEKFTEPKVERLRVKTREIFSGPHILIKQSPVAGERTLRAALLKGDALFTHSVVGIHAPQSDIELLAECCLFLNSRVPLYYSMMTSRKWLVERGELEKDEIMDLPIPPLGMGGITYEYLCELATTSNWEEKLRHSIEQMYDLSEEEEILIDDAIDYTLEYFHLKTRSNAANSIMRSEGGINILSRYLETITATLRNSFSRDFEAIIFQGDAPLDVIALRPAGKDHRSVRISLEKSQQKLDDTLRDIDNLLRDQRSTGVFIQRIARVYIGDSIYIVKPDQKRYWTRSLALRDADEIYVDIINARGVALESA